MNPSLWIEKTIVVLKKTTGLLRDFWSGVCGIFKGFLDKITDITRQSDRNQGRKDQSIKNQDAIGKSRQISGFQPNIRSILSGKFGFLRDKFLEAFSADHVPEGKRRAMIFGLTGLAVLFLILVIAVLALNFGKKNNTANQNIASGLNIPAEELFFPAEPDFLPEFLFEKEMRTSWSLEDIRPYWKNPGAAESGAAGRNSLPADSERWREEIKSTVDELLEGVL